MLNTAFTKPWTPRQLSILSTTEGAETVAQAMDRVMGGPAGQQVGTWARGTKGSRVL